jgi:hypothetical protein
MSEFTNKKKKKKTKFIQLEFVPVQLRKEKKDFPNLLLKGDYIKF